MATGGADPPGYFVGRPLQYEEEPPPQAPPPPPPAAPPPAPAPAVRNYNNAVAAHVPGYYSAGPIQPRPQEPADPAPAQQNSATTTTTSAGPAAQRNKNNPGSWTRWFGCFFG